MCRIHMPKICICFAKFRSRRTWWIVLYFWSKNPRPFFDFLPEIQQLGYPFYFQFTLNPYEAAIEQNLPALDERIDTFHRLSAIIGPERIVWRYDPVIIDEAHPLNWHGEQFERLCALLHADTCRCVFSFFDRYAKESKMVFAR